MKTSNVVICTNCKRFHIDYVSHVDRCVCGCKTFHETHESNRKLAENYGKFEYYDKDDYIEFSHGVLETSTYSYSIDSNGQLELSKEDTYKLYLRMKEYFEDEK